MGILFLFYKQMRIICIWQGTHPNCSKCCSCLHGKPKRPAHKKDIWCYSLIMNKNS